MMLPVDISSNLLSENRMVADIYEDSRGPRMLSLGIVLCTACRRMQLRPRSETLNDHHGLFLAHLLTIITLYVS